MAILAVHHWSDDRAGSCEFQRVARRRVIVVHWDQAVVARLWLTEAQTEHERGDGVERLQRDLSNGTWAARHRALLDQTELDSTASDQDPESSV